MKIPVIKDLVGRCSIEDLRAAEDRLMEGEDLGLEVGGEDEGEQLTHILAAIAILEQMDAEGIPFAEALRNYSKRVRDSIS